MSKQRRSRRDVLTAAGVAGVTALAGCLGGGGGEGGGNGNESGNGSGGGGAGGNGTSTQDGSGGGGTDSGGNGSDGGQAQLADQMTIFHAGSLAPPFEAAEAEFEAQYDVQVLREAQGSVASTQKITEQGRTASVLGVSDYRLLRDMLLPEFGDWYSIFATNAMTIAYTEDSAYADEITPDNWGEILARDDVRFAHSDPAIDPNGYRSIMTMQLGMIPFEGDRLYGEDIYNTLREKELVPTGTESALLGQLQTGAFDYAFGYASASTTYDVQTVDLQPAVDLSRATAKYARHYSQAVVETDAGTFTGAPIAYGITVPNVADSPELGARWVEYMVTDPGQQILRESGFQPTEPAVVPTDVQDAVPQRVLENAEALQSLGPLEL